MRRKFIDSACMQRGRGAGIISMMFNVLIRGVWTVAVLSWPILKWVLSIEAFIRFVVMICQWDNPVSHAGWTFTLHFIFLTAINYFVEFYSPEDS